MSNIIGGIEEKGGGEMLQFLEDKHVDMRTRRAAMSIELACLYIAILVPYSRRGSGSTEMQATSRGRSGKS